MRPLLGAICMDILHSIEEPGRDAPVSTSSATLLACVEVGGSSTESVLFDVAGRHEVVAGACQPPGSLLALAVPGILDGHRVLAASNLGWFDIDPAEQLGLAGPIGCLLNDAEAAALGEAALRGGQQPDRLVYIGLGTGVGGAIVDGGEAAMANLFGHSGGFSADECRCGRVGCLETVAAGWALPVHLTRRDLVRVATAVAAAVEPEACSRSTCVVVGGGLARRHPLVVDEVARRLASRQVEPSRAPKDAKSAAAWGLRNRIHGAAEAASARGECP